MCAPTAQGAEVFGSHSEKKALKAGAFLRFPELWVLDIPRDRLTLYHLAARGKHRGTYRPQPRSRAFPVLTSAEVLDRLDAPEADDVEYFENCRDWARQVHLGRAGKMSGSRYSPGMIDQGRQP